MTISQSTPDRHIPQLTPDEIARFWSKVDQSDRMSGCWLWTDSTARTGYGAIKIRGFDYVAHRVAYELLVGPIPDGKVLDHVRDRGCTNRHCVNPAHLEVVTRAINTLRGTSFSAENARKTHCANGHPFTPENTRWGTEGTRIRRHCHACERMWTQNYKRRKRAERRA